MLSRVADNLYWLARYLERTENLGRLVGATTNLMLDLPRHLAPGWQPLVKITGSELAFHERGEHDYSERSIVRFLIADAKHEGSMVSSIARAREIARTARDIMPREFWERVNALYLFVGEQAPAAIDKSTRHSFLERVTGGVQQLIGMLEGVVSEGEALSFMSLGRNIERADMTSRIVDVRAATLPVSASAELGPFDTVLWMNVLRSLSGYQMYRMHTGDRIHGAGVVRFLLADEQFPRACVCCLHRAEEVLHTLPRSEPLVRWLARTRRVIMRARLESFDQLQLHEFIDRFQLSLARWNDELVRIYFLGELKPSATAGT